MLAQETKDEISAQRFGSNPEAAGLRQQDAQVRADLLTRAREVEPQAQQHTWLLAK